MDTQNFKYVLLPAKVRPNDYFEAIHDKVFDYWEKVWADTFAKSGHPIPNWRDDFLRQDIITAILNADEVIGCHLYSFFDLHSHATLKAGYLSMYPSEAVQYLKDSGFKNVMGMEYLCVNPKYRHFSDQFTFGEILSGLGFYVAKAFDADCVIGTPIKRTSVPRMSEMFGATCLQQSIKKYGYELSIIAVPLAQLKPHPSKDARELMAKLWKGHTSYLYEQEHREVA